MREPVLPRSPAGGRSFVAQLEFELCILFLIRNPHARGLRIILLKKEGRTQMDTDLDG